MTREEILMVMLYIIELVVIGIFYNLYKHWKQKHNEAVDAWSIECDRKDKHISSI